MRYDHTSDHVELGMLPPLVDGTLPALAAPEVVAPALTVAESRVAEQAVGNGQWSVV